MTKLFIHLSIINIFILFSESNAHMMPDFLIRTEKQYKTQFSVQYVKYNKFDWRIMQNRKRQNYL